MQSPIYQNMQHAHAFLYIQTLRQQVDKLGINTAANAQECTVKVGGLPGRRGRGPAVRRRGGPRARRAVEELLRGRRQLHLLEQGLPAQRRALRLHEGLQLAQVLALLSARLPEEQH